MGSPVVRRKGDAPEIGARLEKFDSDFCFPLTNGRNTDNATRLLLVGFRILQNDNLADAYREIQSDESAVSIDDGGVSLLAEHFPVGTRSDDGDGHAKEDTLAAAAIVLCREMRRERGHGLRR